jgi:hypothetical protein
VLDDDAGGVQDLALLGPTQRLDLLDYVGEIQRLEPPLAQQRRLLFGPDVEILVVEVFGLRANSRGHAGSPLTPSGVGP